MKEKAKFKAQIKTQGRVLIPSNVRLALNLKPLDWIYLTVEIER